MDLDTCFICADDITFAAFGPCGCSEPNSQVCSTCSVRSRSLGNNLQCHFCTIHCDIVLVSKANGSVKNGTRNYNFSSISTANPTEGAQGDFWFNEASRAFFDNQGEYQRVKSLIEVSCTICVNPLAFECVGALMIHLLENHQRYLCTICLVWRERFISEQRLFTSEELKQHIREGDSEVEAGIIKHFLCEQCRNPFYGDKKIYVHMPLHICPCHICDGLRPKSGTTYLEDHFRQVVHIGPENDYWNSDFPIIRAFADEDALEVHNEVCHEESSEARMRQFGWRSWQEGPRR